MDGNIFFFLQNIMHKNFNKISKDLIVSLWFHLLLINIDSDSQIEQKIQCQIAYIFKSIFFHDFFHLKIKILAKWS